MLKTCPYCIFHHSFTVFCTVSSAYHSCTLTSVVVDGGVREGGRQVPAELVGEQCRRCGDDHQRVAEIAQRSTAASDADTRQCAAQRRPHRPTAPNLHFIHDTLSHTRTRPLNGRVQPTQPTHHMC